MSRRRQPAGPAAGATCRRIAIDRQAVPRPHRRRAGSPGPSAWKVRTRTAPPPTPSGASADVEPLAQLLGRALVERDRGDLARFGRLRSISQAIRATSVVVLPLPAGATHRIGPGGAVAAARWSGASRARRSATAGWRVTRPVSRRPLIGQLSTPDGMKLQGDVDVRAGLRRSDSGHEPPGNECLPNREGLS